MKEQSISPRTCKPYYLWLVAILFILLGILIDIYYTKYNNNSIVTLSKQPSIKLHKNFISEEQAKHLITLAKARLAPSTVFIQG